MNTSLHYYRGGMGQQPTTAQMAGAAATGAGTAATQFMHGSYIAGAGTAIMTAAMFTGPAAPFVAIAGAAVELIGAIFPGLGKGCGQKCITATTYANRADALLQQNLNTYLGLPAPRAQSAQQAALNIFDQIFAGLVQACSDPSLGDAGKRCISDRQQGSCAWRTSPAPGCGTQNSCWAQDASGAWTFRTGGAAGSGNACWNWFIGYRDPIANDPNVVPDAAATSSVAGALTSGGIDPTWLLIGGAAVVAFLLIQGMSS